MDDFSLSHTTYDFEGNGGAEPAVQMSMSFSDEDGDLHDLTIEIFVDTPLDVCRERDTTGVYDRAERGEIAMLPGLTGPYDAPSEPDLHLDSGKTPLEYAQLIFDHLQGPSPGPSQIGDDDDE